MTGFDTVKFPETAAGRAVRRYLEAQAAKDFGNAAEFFADEEGMPQ